MLLTTNKIPFCRNSFSLIMLDHMLPFGLFSGIEECVKYALCFVCYAQGESNSFFVYYVHAFSMICNAG